MGQMFHLTQFFVFYKKEDSYLTKNSVWSYDAEQVDYRLANLRPTNLCLCSPFPTTMLLLSVLARIENWITFYDLMISSRRSIRKKVRKSSRQRVM